MNPNRMITASIFLIFIGLIISAIGGFLYNTYSTSSTNDSFKNAQDERSQLKNKLNEEFINNSEEMRLHKDSLNEKVEKEANAIISELKVKSKEANKSLENLKEQSDKATSAVSNEVKKLKDVTETELKKLSYPIPSELSATDIIVFIKPNGLEEFLPELREKYKTESLLTEHKGKGKYRNVNFSLLDNKTNPKLLSLFEGETLNISCQIGDENGPFKNKKSKFIWELNTVITLDNKETHLLYFVDYEKEPSDYIRFSLGNTKKLIQNSKLRLYSGISSALELCGQRVYLGFQIGNNQMFLSPRIELKHLGFRDNNSKDYYIEFDGTFTVRDSNAEIKKRSPHLNIPPYNEITYITGHIRCVSF